MIHGADASEVVLIVEDSDDDFDIAMRALKKGKALTNPIVRCENGREALDYLFQSGRFADPAIAPRPGIVLLDLNMPGLDGFDVLRTIKNDDSLKSIPVLVMTNSDSEQDVQTCYRAGANTYIQKPVDFASFTTVMQRLGEYWLDIAILPRL